jgi:hypothetical protein
MRNKIVCDECGNELRHCKKHKAYHHADEFHLECKEFGIHLNSKKHYELRMHKHVIQSLVEKDKETGSRLYWNKIRNSWTIKKLATRFSKEAQKNFNLPTQSKWEEVR